MLRELVANRVPFAISPQKKGETLEEFRKRRAAHPNATFQRPESDEQYKARLAREGVAIKQVLGRLINGRAYAQGDQDTRRELMIEQIARVRARF